jgi:hypothetical protein
MVRSFSAGRSDSLTPLKTFLDSVAAVADFLHSFLNCWGKRFATLKEKTRIAKAFIEKAREIEARTKRNRLRTS